MMEEMVKECLHIDIDVRPTSYMRPDIEEKRNPGSHPGYNAVSKGGNLVDVVVGSVAKMAKLMKAGKNREVGELAQYVNHLVCDAHMITQIVPDLIKHDGKMDALAEFVGNKDGGVPVSLTLGDTHTKEPTLRELLKQSIAETVELYDKPFRKNRFLFVLKYLGPMTRRCAFLGKMFGFEVMREAKKAAHA